MGRRHQCGAKCTHTCAEAGGKLRNGKPCLRPGRWGIKGATVGYYGLCRQHDPQQSPTRSSTPGLNNLQHRFVAQYTGPCNGNGTRAARVAGYSGTDQVLGATACALLKLPKIRAAIDRRFDELGMTQQEVVKRITDDARLDISPIVTIDPVTKVVGVNLTPDLLLQYGTLIKEIDTDPLTGRITKIRFNDSQAARRDMAKIRQLFTDGPTVNVVTQVQSLTDEQLQAKLAAAVAGRASVNGNRHTPSAPAPRATVLTNGHPGRNGRNGGK